MSYISYYPIEAVFEARCISPSLYFLPSFRNVLILPLG